MRLWSVAAAPGRFSFSAPASGWPAPPERATHDDQRHGPTDLSAALDVKAGTAIGAGTGRHRAVELRAVPRLAG